MATPRFTTGHAAWLLGALVFAAMLWWLASRIEWVEVDIHLPPKDAAARDDLYTTKALARHLGARVVTRENFGAMPPPHATLYLASSHWNMFEGRDAALRRWVEGGGNLILANWLFAQPDEDHALTWIPLDWKRIQPANAASAPSAASAALAALPRALRDVDHDCHDVAVGDARLAPFNSRSRYRLCAEPGRVIQSRAPLVWALDDKAGHVFVSARVGQGRVSATSAWEFFDNENALRGDNPLLIAALLNLQPGGVVWFVAEEKREPVMVWLWQRGWPAVLLGASALALGLWRSGVRFGPRLATPSRARRSIVEQITGTARFIAKHDGAPLHRAEVRALDDAAVKRIANYRALPTPRERADAIAKATHLHADELAAALDRKLPRTLRALASALVTIEHARRALLAPANPVIAAPATPPDPSDSPSTRDPA